MIAILGGFLWYMLSGSGQRDDKNYEIVRRKEITKMADYLNEKYGLSLQIEDCIYYREQDDTKHADLFGNGITYQIPYIAVFQSQEEQYAPLAQELKEFQVNYDGQTLQQICGTAETPDADSTEVYMADIDGDGENETYEKYEWYPGNQATRRWLYFDLQGEHAAGLGKAIDDILWGTDEARGSDAVLLWIDETEFGNVVYVLYEDALYDFHISGFLYQDEAFRKILQTNYVFELEARINHVSAADGRYAEQ